jgi:PIN domain nuclease of toxin-antitoxin system
MNILLDTHILIWWNEDNPKLSSKARAFIQDTDNTKFVSAVSIWEIAIKTGTGKLTLDLAELLGSLELDGFILLSFHSHHASRVATLAKYHNDPFDRALIAQSLAEGLHLLTHDDILAKYGEHVIFV